MSFFARVSMSFDRSFAADVDPIKCPLFCLADAVVEVGEFAAMIEESSGGGGTTDFSNDAFLDLLDKMEFTQRLTQCLMLLESNLNQTLWKSNILSIRFIDLLHYLHS